MVARWQTVLLLTLSVGGTAAATEPTAAPTTTSRPAVAAVNLSTTVPATQPINLSDPRGTLRLFATALRDGDVEKLRRSVVVQSPPEEQMLIAMEQMAAGVAALHDATARQFGESGAAQLTGDVSAQFNDSLQRIEAADIAIDGDKANVRYSGAKASEYELRKIGGEWKIPMAQFAHGVDVAALTRRVAESKAQAAMMLEMTVEVGAGKYKTADAAAETWRSRIMQGVGGEVPRTRPTTATAPSR